jgi:hypothetical protein
MTAIGARGGQNSLSLRFGAVTAISQTLKTRSTGEDILSILGGLIEDNPTLEDYASCNLRISDRTQDGDFEVEIQNGIEAYPLDKMRWNISPTGQQERTTVDINGNPIVLSYAPALDWAIGGGIGFAFTYTTYADQVGEADKYISCEEISGTITEIIPEGSFITYISGLREWQNTINSAEFFGHAIGNVLCLGWTTDMIGERLNGDYLVESRVRFSTKPGSILSMWSESGTVAAGGWNSWHYWKDPTNGMVPDDVHSTDGAYVEVQHYALKDFTSLYEVST